MTKIKMTYLKFTLSFILCLISYISSAQTKSTEIKTINGKKYYIHKVEKGQSLYAIAKTYSIDVNSILAENDEAIDGLKPGQELKIPFESLLPKSTNVIDTNKYVYHKIVKGETIYSITRKYSIDEKKLASYNPTITGGLKEGEYLIVGEKKKNSNVKPASSVSKTTYTVAVGETLYSISKKTNVSQDNILKWNPEVKNGIKPGQVLKIAAPAAGSTSENEEDDAVANTVPPVLEKAPSRTDSKWIKGELAEETANNIIISKPKKTAYHIGLFLPFKLAESESINVDELAKAKVSFPATQALALDFYAGFKKAVDSLVAKDFDITIHLFDTEDRDSAKVEAICKTPEFKNLDAIFGPLYSNVFKIVAKNAKSINVPIVSPVIQQNKILFDNRLVSKVTPSVYTLIEGLADYSLDSLSSANIIIVNTTAKDQTYIKTFKTKYNEGLLTHKKTSRDTITEVRGIAGVKAAYKADKPNVVVLFTNNQVYLQDFITQLYVFADKKDISLMGFSSVSNIDNLDQDYLNALHFHFASANHINLKDSVTAVLAKQYQELYTADPSEYYFQSFDIGMYYLSHLKNLGPDFFLNLDNNHWQGVSTDFKFFKPDADTGFENKAVNIYKYSNYQLQKTGWK